METRGRGRDSGASTEENPSTSNPSNNLNPPTPTPASRALSTRSRTRRSALVTRHPSSRTTRSNTTNLANRPTAAHPGPSAPQAQPAPSTATRSRRNSASNRRAAAAAAALVVATPSNRPSSTFRQLAVSAAPAASSSVRPPNSRKRTRSSSRRNPAQEQPVSVAPSHSLNSASESPAAAAAASAATVAILPRPSKRARRASHPGRHSRNLPNPSVARRPSAGPASSRRRSGDMDPVEPPGASNERQSEPNDSRRDDGSSNMMGVDRTGAQTLQGLLRRLGADFSDIFPGNVGTSQTRLSHLRTAISSPESDEQQIQALSELCEFLSVGTEESLVSFSVNLFVAPLIQVLRTGSNIEIKILAARALTHMMEALPSSSSSIANHGAADPLCQNLLSIEYIDLAEQSLYALRKLSVDYPQQIVAANGFQAVLSFIDFFSIGVQRIAAQTACNLCRLSRPDTMDMVSGVLPIMMRLLDSEDQRIRESAVLGFTRLAESCKAASGKLETLCGEQADLIDKFLGLIVPSSPPALAPPSYASALRLLAVISRGNATLGLKILATNSLILRLQSRLSSGLSLHAIDCLLLAESLLPDFPENDEMRSRRRRRNAVSAYYAVDAKRVEELSKDVAPLEFFGRTLFGVLMKFYISSADANARKSALCVMSKFIKIAPENVLMEVMQNNYDSGDGTQKSNSIRFCPFIAALLGENSSRNETMAGLRMAESALQKLPSLRDPFIREGVVHEMVRLAAFDVEVPVEEGEVDEAGASTVAPADRSPSARSPADQMALNAALRNMDSIRSAVAAIQRESVQRAPRGELVVPSHRIPGRPVDIRPAEALSMQPAAPKTARSILESHFGAQTDGKMDESMFTNTRLGKLTSISAALKNASSPRGETGAKQALSDLVDLLTSSERLTVFEISRSGAMEALAQYMAPTDAGIRYKRMSSFIQVLNQDKGRGAFSSLVDLTLGVLSSEEKLSLQTHETSSGNGNVSMGSGLRQLAQPFKLRLRKSPERSASNLRDYSHHVVLIEPLATMGSVQGFLWPKVKESENSSAVGSGSNGRRSNPHRDSRPSLPSDGGDQNDEMGTNTSGDPSDDQQADEMDEEGYGDDGVFDMEEENNEDEEMVDEDDEEQNSEPSDEEVSSGEEDVIGQDVGESDDHEPDSAESFDVDHLATSLPPFELDHETLGQAPSRGRRPIPSSIRDSGNRAGSASRHYSDNLANFRSYAAALAANMPRSMDRIAIPGIASSHAGGFSRRRGMREVGRDSAGITNPPKLSFTLNGKSVPQDCSILSAVIQCSPEGRSIGHRMWSDVHTLIYTKVEPVQGPVDLAAPGSTQGSGAGDDKVLGSNTDDAGPVRRSQRLLEHREKTGPSPVRRRNIPETEASAEALSNVGIFEETVPAPRPVAITDLPSSVASVIEVLRQLEWIYIKMSDRAMRTEGMPSMVEGLREDREVQFTSNKLSAKLIRQLSDPLALCGGAVPNWCFSLARDASFLIPFETRRILFQSTSLGVARSLHLLQTRVERSGIASSSLRSSRSHRDHETRIGRIQRQKVRLHRNRILESAIKVMNFYGKHSTVLEVEYFNEVGTGLGPTLEFYTLASREIQKVDLGLWRGTAPSVAKQKSQSAEQSSGKEQKTEIPAGRSGSTVKRRSRRHSQIPSSARTPASLIEEEDAVAYVTPTGKGLFPSCLPIVANDSQKEASAKSTALFGFVGRLVGKAIVDGRLLDMRFSKSLCNLLLAYCRVYYERWISAQSSGEKGTVKSDASNGRRLLVDDLDSAGRNQVWEVFSSGTSAMKVLENVDPQLATSLKKILDMVWNGQGDSVSSLCLTFVLPGDDEVELVRSGADKEVTGENAEEFVRRVVYHVLFGGVQQQVEALLRGLNEVLDIRGLLSFAGSELEMLICGPAFEKWTIDFLVQATRCDHGYSHESPAVLNFMKVLSEMDQPDQQRFVIFATGSPALPLGGLRNLHPRLTIVRRTPESGRSPDECLPTVMTCTNYFKLPDFSSIEITRRQLMYAVLEGQGSFHLS